MTKPEFKDTMKNHIVELEEAIAGLSKLRDIIEDFDGKVYNVRLDRAVQKEIPGFFIHHSVYTTDLSVSYRSNWSCVHILSINRGQDFDGRRINAERILEKIDDAEAKFNINIEQYKFDIENAYKVVEEYNKIALELKALKDKLSDEAIEALRYKFERI